jgi:hypothetical protein
MKPAIISIETAEETFSFDVSDEALEKSRSSRLERALGYRCAPVDRLNRTQLDFGQTADRGSGCARSLIPA